MDSQAASFSIKDTGAGLTAVEVADYLATVGSGCTRVQCDASALKDLIGRFGLGFLSAYVVADKCGGMDMFIPESRCGGTFC